ncbi:CG11211 [Drosophila busckii]|uniref:CG11211 n=1 Tax=Drosophila busckii TaxID=30019 RepID=A0A0M3QXP8_DROBS|nr:C-type lectin 37Db [Drosophila busckii]ALC46303.1 CG11211 [Drosophila busckii]
MFYLLPLLLAACLPTAFADADPNTAYCTKVIGNVKYTQKGQKNYFIGKSQTNWFEAVHTCRQLGGNLAVIESDVELKFIQEYLIENRYDANHQFWISGNDLVKDGTFYSINDGFPLRFLAWSKNQPDNLGIEKCIHLFMDGAEYKMNNEKCDNHAFYLCEKRGSECCIEN